MSAPGSIFDGDHNPNTILGTRGDDSIGGAGGDDHLYDGMGDDVVFAGSEDDTVYACLGNDWYDGGEHDTVGDSISFAYLDVGPDGQNNTFNLRGVTFDLTKSEHNLGYLGRKTVYGFEHVHGSWGNDKIYGDSGANQLRGDLGNDRLEGRAGNDILAGSSGLDTLIGGAGRDDMSAFVSSGNLFDGERDLFVFLALSDSTTNAATCDMLTGYFRGNSASSDGDRIDLRRIDANPLVDGNQQFKFVASLSANGVGEVSVTRAAGGSDSDFYVHIDTDSDAAREMLLYVQADDSGILVAADFIL